MAHSMILGMTESGKTTLAKQLATGYMAAGVVVLLLDPLNDPEFPADYRTTDPTEFLDTFWASRSCAVFIDEAGDSVGKFDTLMQKTATRGRHWGHNVHYITQRGTQLSKTVRDQCSNLFLFTTSLSDAKVHADEWNQQEIKAANSLKQGDYYHVTRFGQLVKRSAFDQ